MPDLLAILYLALYLLTGAVTGVVAGLMGVGGGLIIVPVLTLLFAAQGFAPDQYVHMAVGTSLASIVPTAIASMRAHHAHGAVDWPMFRTLAPTLCAGTAAGAAAAQWMDGSVLRGMVGFFELYVALRMGISMSNRTDARNAGVRYSLPPPVAGGGIGLLSALVGIGGGSLTVPYLSRRGTPIHRAVGTSAACGLPIGLTGCLLFAVLPQSTGGGVIGQIHLPALLCIAVTSVLTAKRGAKLAHTLSRAALQSGFALFLLLAAVGMFAGSG